MKLFLIFFSIAVSICCQREGVSIKSNNNHNDIQYLGETVYFDSLKDTNPDHLISYKSDCSGCFQGTDVTYYLWQANGVNHTTKIQDSVLYTSKSVIELDNFEYLYDSVRDEKWITPMLSMSHYHYKEFTVDFKDHHLKYRITELEKNENENSYRVRFTSVMDSTIKTIQESDWQVGPKLKL